MRRLRFSLLSLGLHGGWWFGRLIGWRRERRRRSAKEFRHFAWRRRRRRQRTGVCTHCEMIRKARWVGRRWSQLEAVVSFHRRKRKGTRASTAQIPTKHGEAPHRQSAQLCKLGAAPSLLRTLTLICFTFRTRIL